MLGIRGFYATNDSTSNHYAVYDPKRERTFAPHVGAVLNRCHPVLIIWNNLPPQSARRIEHALAFGSNYYDRRNYYL